MCFLLPLFSLKIYTLTHMHFICHPIEILISLYIYFHLDIHTFSLMYKRTQRMLAHSLCQVIGIFFTLYMCIEREMKEFLFFFFFLSLSLYIYLYVYVCKDRNRKCVYINVKIDLYRELNFSKFVFFVLWHINLHWLFNVKVVLLEEQWWYFLAHSCRE